MEKALEMLRYAAFWILDFAKGGNVKKHVKDIQFILENYQSPQSAKRRAENLQNLLAHACETTAFYKPFAGFNSLNDFPVIDKMVIRSNSGGLQSEEFKGRQNHLMQTSGSSGIITKILHDKNKRDRNTADTIYFKGRAGFKLGHRLYYIRKWFEMHTKSPLVTWFRNIEMVDVSKFTDAYLAGFIEKLENDRSNKMLLGYSSGYTEICGYLDRKKSAAVKTNIRCIVAMSEALSDQTRSSLEKYFNAPVISRYSNLENGIFSMQLPGKGSCFHINWASYYIEMLHPDNDTPVANGEVGRVVITDLFNFCMPIIRYDTGDLAIMTTENRDFNKAPAFSRVEGRKMDALYNTSGVWVSPYIVFEMESYEEIRQFQLIQEGEKSYTIKLNVSQPFKAEAKLIALYKSYFGVDADIRFEYVDEIPQLSSGKRRLTVNNHTSQSGKMLNS